MVPDSTSGSDVQLGTDEDGEVLRALPKQLQVCVLPATKEIELTSGDLGHASWYNAQAEAYIEATTPTWSG